MAKSNGCSLQDGPTDTSAELRPGESDSQHFSSFGVWCPPEFKEESHLSMALVVDEVKEAGTAEILWTVDDCVGSAAVVALGAEHGTMGFALQSVEFFG